MKLTEAQEKAIHHYTGPALVLAVPGAGKTTVLLHRIRNLIEERGVGIEKILSITFSKAQAVDMAGRFDSFGYAKRPYFSTIHAFAYQIIRAYCKEEKRNVRLIEGDKFYNKYSLIKRLYYSYNHSFIREDSLEDFFTSHSYIKNSMLDLDSYLDKYNPKVKNFKKLYLAYEKFKRENHMIDFDDMLDLALKILREDEAILARIRRAFPFIQVDEAQDTSRVQLEIIKLIAKPNNNLFLLADDDQAIYSFRGANPQDLLNFKATYPGAQIITMNENHRSTGSITKLAKVFIKSNKFRYRKNMTSKKEGGRPVRLVTAKRLNSQNQYLVKNISKDLDEKMDVAVLYRSNISSLALINELKKNNIPYYSRDKKKTYLSHFVIRDVLDILKLAEDRTDLEAYERVYYKLNAYLKKSYLAYLRSLRSSMDIFASLMDLPGLEDYQRENISDLSFSFDRVKKLDLYQAISYIVDVMGYGDYLEDKVKKSGSEGISPRLVLDSLKELARGLDSPYQLEDRLREIKGERTSPQGKSLTLSTVHSSKGLEFDSVYLIDLVEGEFPSSPFQDLDPEDEEMALEEERRLFYVAMTRARAKLTLMALKSRNSRPVLPSRFFTEIQALKK